MHPFVPFISEEIWQNISERSIDEALIISKWPEQYDVNASIIEDFNKVTEVISGIRTIRKEKNISFKDTIFCLPKNPEKELWDGKRIGPKKAKEKFNFVNSFSTEKLEETLESEFLKTNNLFLPFSESDELEVLVNNILRKFKNSNRKGTNPPQKIFDTSQIISSFRLIKDQSEIKAVHIANFLEPLITEKIN